MLYLNFIAPESMIHFVTGYYTQTGLCHLPSATRYMANKQSFEEDIAERKEPKKN